MKIYDISVPLSNTQHVWSGDPVIHIQRRSDMERGDRATVSQLNMGAHSGTHVDAPLHFIIGGSTVDRMDLNVLIGPAQVVDLGEVERTVTVQDLESCGLAAGAERILCKTRNAGLWSEPAFQQGFVGLVPDAARWLLERGVKLVGIDYLSIEPFGSHDHAVHHLLLEAGVIIVEGLDLHSVPAGNYDLVCLPIKIKGAEGAPARAVLIEP
ncbi:MAG: cyclase family protein [Rudaea sp.]